MPLLCFYLKVALTNESETEGDKFAPELCNEKQMSVSGARRKRNVRHAVSKQNDTEDYDLLEENCNENWNASEFRGKMNSRHAMPYQKERTFEHEGDANGKSK